MRVMFQFKLAKHRHNAQNPLCGSKREMAWFRQLSDPRSKF